MEKIEFEDIRAIDYKQFPENIKQAWSDYVTKTIGYSNDIYVCFNNELYEDDEEHDIVFDYLYNKCGVTDERVLISRWW